MKKIVFPILILLAGMLSAEEYYTTETYDYQDDNYFIIPKAAYCDEQAVIITTLSICKEDSEEQDSSVVLNDDLNKQYEAEVLPVAVENVTQTEIAMIAEPDHVAEIVPNEVSIIVLDNEISKTVTESAYTEETTDYSDDDYYQICSATVR